MERPLSDAWALQYSKNLWIGAAIRLAVSPKPVTLSANAITAAG
jgi:hypothetical protein